MYGLAHLERAAAGEKLRMADAFAAAQSGKQSWMRWARDHELISGAR